MFNEMLRDLSRAVLAFRNAYPTPDLSFNYIRRQYDQNLILNACIFAIPPQLYALAGLLLPAVQELTFRADQVNALLAHARQATSDLPAPPQLPTASRSFSPSTFTGTVTDEQRRARKR